MAEELDKKKVTALSELTTVSDNDIYITGEGGQAPLRKITFATIAEAIKTKLLTWTFNALNTTTKTLTGAINELNARLVTMPMPLISGLTTEELINTAYNDAHSNTTNQTHYRLLLDHGTAHSILGGGRYLLEGYRENAAYGWQITISYAIGTSTQPNRCFERSLINGTWSTWTKRPTRTEVDTLNSKIVYENFSVQIEFEAGTPSSYVSVQDIPIAKPGYTPISVSLRSVPGAAGLNIYSLQFAITTGTARIAYGRNGTGAAYSNTVGISVVYIKTS